MSIYFSSDWHLGHANIIKYDGRPFKDVEEMDLAIITNVTEQLKKGDTLYYLGDFGMTRSRNDMEGHMKALALTGANLFFIKGNHDKTDTLRLYQRYGTYLGEQKKIKIPLSYLGNTPDVQEIVLNHYAMRVWDKSHRGTWHLYGHSHHSLPDLEDSLSFDVGINGWDYKLVSFAEVQQKMAKKKYKPIDHHKPDRE
jgi:calcineurin-like phosphoesterase family protein